MTIEEMKKRKIELGYSNNELSEKSGVPVGTLQKIFSGETKAPRRDTIFALEEVLKEKPVLYGTKKVYTLEDYLALPEDMRVELIDGAFYDMAGPHAGHQGLCSEIFVQLRNYVVKTHGTCVPMLSPLDVQLDEDDKTVVQPDVMVICDRSRFKNGRIWGAPDLIIEVLSPSTKKKDMYLKCNKYYNAGVKEYWMIDWEKQKTIVYNFQNEEFPMIYGMDAKIPVNIWDGECKIDMQEIVERIGFLYE